VRLPLHVTSARRSVAIVPPSLGVVASSLLSR
jgi:hypothetical protein